MICIYNICIYIYIERERERERERKREIYNCISLSLSLSVYRGMPLVPAYWNLVLTIKPRGGKQIIFSRGGPRPAGIEAARLGPAPPSSARFGPVLLGLGMARLGSALFSPARPGQAWLSSVWLGVARSGPTRLSSEGWARVRFVHIFSRWRLGWQEYGRVWKSWIISPSTWRPRGGGLLEIFWLQQHFAY